MNYNCVERPASFFGVPDSLFSHLTLDVDDTAMTATIVYVKVAVEHTGAFRRLVAAIEASPYKLIIYCPVRRTRGIIARLGYGPIDDDNWMKGVPVTDDQINSGVYSYSYHNDVGDVYD